MRVPVGGRGLCLIQAGSYLLRPEGTVGIKLAREIKAQADAYVDLPDMSAPDNPFVEWQMRGALLLAVYSLSRGRDVYAGCMGGYGRTGVFLSLLVRCLGVLDPISYVRREYHPRAVETLEQADYVEQFDPSFMRIVVAGARAWAGWHKITPETPYAPGGYRA
jgi:hypothetical protein